MKAKPGKLVNTVPPVSPATAFEADPPDPTKAAEMKASQRAAQTGKYGSNAAAGVGVMAANAESDPECWVEFALNDTRQRPVAGEKYVLTLPNGTTLTGSTDANGKARVACPDAGGCSLALPDRHQNTW